MICYRNLFISCYILFIDDLLFNYKNIVVLSFLEIFIFFFETSKFGNRFTIVICLNRYNLATLKGLYSTMLKDNVNIKKV